MQLSDYLSLENVVLDLAASSKKDLLSKLADATSSRAGITKTETINALVAREGLGSTGIGQGIAIPHCIVESLTQSICMFFRLARPVDFEAVDDVPVDLVVVLLSPPAQQGQSLNILSCIARRLRDDKLASAVRNAETAEEAYVLLTSG